ncbi:MAG: sulfatase-like hydrolase/transferase [Deltaproteobacteria bacterium]|nr:sulfatase-like hydrolase/transferase [Deltaproteobacteria bacterium]
MTDAAHSRPSYHWILASGLLLGIYIAFQPAMQGNFLMSDTRVVVENPRLLSLHGLLSIWSPGASDVYTRLDQYQPLTYTLLWFERHLFGLDPRAYQLVSVLLHAFNSLLVWGLLARIGVRGAFVAACLFALHPVQVESVVWIYEQKNPLSGAFFFLALHAYLAYDAGEGRSRYVASLACFAAALLAKSATVVLPALLLLHAWVCRPPLRWRSVVPTLPFFALAAAMAGLTIWHEIAVTGAGGAAYDADLLTRLARSGWITGFHATKILVPTGLAFFYPLWRVDPMSAAAWIPNLTIAVVIAAAWLGRDRGTRPALLGVGWYLVAMFPVMGFFDIYYHQFSLTADHFQYLPALGLIALVVHSAAGLLERVGPRRNAAVGARPPAPAIVAGLLAVVACGALSWQRSAVFANDGLLAQDSATKYPKSFLAFQKIGESTIKRSLLPQEDPESLRRQAIAAFKRAIELRPDHAQARDSLGTAYLLSGRFAEARDQMQIAVELVPDSAVFHQNFAGVLEQLEQREWALAEYRAMLAASDDQATARFVLARALVRAKRLNEAIGELDLAIEATVAQADRSPLQAEVLRQARQLRLQTAARLAVSLEPPIEPQDTPRWNVLLLTIDTLRPDYLSMNGYDWPTSPALDALLGSGVYFEQALAPVPRTTPALASLLTGAYPHVTGVRALGSQLPAEMVTIAEALQADGYQTMAVVTNLLLASVRGLDAGFDVYDAAFDVRDARRTTDTAIRWLESADSDRPLFAWVHYIDPHVPYHPTSEIADSIDPDYTGRFREGFGRQPRSGEPDDLFLEFPEGLSKSELAHRNPLEDAENEHIRRLYAGDIRMVDREIERLIETLRRRFPRTVIVFAADHGESLGEHDFYFDHGDYVYNASSRVPLGFVLPPEHPWHGAGRRSGWVSLVDVAPTLFDVLGRPAPPEMSVLFEGRSLAASLRGDDVPPEPVFVESGTSFFPELVRRRQRNDVTGRFRAVTLGDWKLIWTPLLPDDEAWELYNVADDPHETNDRYRPDHPEVAALRRHLEHWLAAEPTRATPATALTAEDREALRKLGYVD